jgi:hypothetical protein
MRRTHFIDLILVLATTLSLAGLTSIIGLCPLTSRTRVRFAPRPWGNSTRTETGTLALKSAWKSLDSLFTG